MLVSINLFIQVQVRQINLIVLHPQIGELPASTIHVPLYDGDTIQNVHLILFSSYVLLLYQVQLSNHLLYFLPVFLDLTRILNLHGLHLQHSIVVFCLELLVHIHQHRVVCVPLLQLVDFGLEACDEHVLVVFWSPNNMWLWYMMILFNNSHR